MFARRGGLVLALCLSLLPAFPARGKEPALFWPSLSLTLPFAHVDLFGDPLPDGAVARLGTVRFRHAGGVYAAYFSPDGKTLTTFGGDDMFRTWALPDGKELCSCRRPGEGPEWFASAAFSADGKFLALGGGTRDGLGDAIVLLYQVAGGKELLRLNVLQAGWAVGSLAFSGDGKVLASGDSQGHIHVWETAGGKELCNLDKETVMVTGLAFSPDGRLLVSGNGRDEWVVWDVATGLKRELPKIWGGSVGKNSFSSHMAFSPDGKTLATANSDNSVRLWDVTDWKVLRRVQRAEEGIAEANFKDITGLAFSPDGKVLAVESWDGPIHLWDPAMGKPLLRIDNHRSHFGWWGGPTVAFSPDGRTLASWGRSSAVSLWDSARGKERTETGAHRCAIRSLAFSPDGRMLATGGADRLLRMWTSGAGKEVRSLACEENVIAVAFSPDGKTLACAGDWHAIRRWHALDGTELPSLKPQEKPGALDWGSPVAVAFSRDSRTLVASSGDYLGFGVCLWDRTQHETESRLEIGQVLCLAFSRDGGLLACGGAGIGLWDSSSHKCLTRFEAGDYMVRGMAFSADGRLLASVSDDSTVRLWELGAGKERRCWSGANCVAVSPVGGLMGTAGDDGVVKVWDLLSGQLLRQFHGHHGAVTAVAFSPDGRLLASASEDTTALLWDVSCLSGKRRPSPLTPSQTEAHWLALGGDDAHAAGDAVATLAAAPQQAVPFLKKRLSPASGRSERLARLIADLNAEAFAVREEATCELEKLGEAARDALEDDLCDEPSLERRCRIERLLGDHCFTMQTAGCRQARRAIEVLEAIGTPDARRLLEVLAGGDPKSWLTQEARASADRLAKRDAAWR